MQLRTPNASELPQLAELWSDAWFDAHEALFPRELIELRTLKSSKNACANRPPTFASLVRPARCSASTDQGRRALSIVCRGQRPWHGVAKQLIEDAEARLAANGVRVAFLACAIGNDRAARFYEKCGWRLARNFMNGAETSAGPFPVECWRYEKQLLARP